MEALASRADLRGLFLIGRATSTSNEEIHENSHLENANQILNSF